MKSYYGMTAHYITDWSLKSRMLACSRFPWAMQYLNKTFSLPGFEEEHDNNLQDDSDVDSRPGEEDGEDIESETLEELEDFYSELNQHVSCFAHALQLVIKDVFKQAASINKVLSKASGIVSHVRKSILSSEVLESEKRLKAANVTKWNSQLKMICSILRIPKEKLDSLDTHRFT